MRSFVSKALFGVLTLSGMLMIPASVSARAVAPFTVIVEDPSGAAVAGASVKQAAGELLGRTDTSGRVTFQCQSPCQIHIDAEGFRSKDLEISASTPVRLDAAAVAEMITVTAYRTPLGELESPVTTRTLSRVDLLTAAPITMDGRIRQLPGVE